MWVWVVLNFLNQFSNACALRMLHNRNAVILELGSPCSLRSALFAHDLNRHGLQRVLPRSITKCFVSNVESYASMTRTCLATICTCSVFVSTTGCSDQSCANSTLRLSLSSDERMWVSFLQRVAPIYPKKQFLREKNIHRSPGNGTFFLPSSTVLVSAPTTGCPDLSVLTTGCPDLSRLGFGIGWLDWERLDGCTTCLSGR